jgi:hypothetical protein
MKNFKVDGNQLTFLDARFYTTESGGFVPSVTTILEAYPKGAAFYKWLKENGEDSDNIRDEAGRRGSVVHDLTERYDKGDEISLLGLEGYPAFKMSEWSMLERYAEFRSRFPFEIEMIEQNFVNESLGYAGTVDRVVIMEGKRYILDIKTSGAVYNSYWLQLAAYKNLYEDATKLKVDGVCVLWLNAKTRTDGKKGDIQGKGWQLLTTEDVSKEAKLFECTKQLWLEENATAKPRLSTYQINYKL